MSLSYRKPPSWKLPAAIVAVIGIVVLLGAVLAYDAIDDEARKEVSETPPKPKQRAAPAKQNAAAKKQPEKEASEEKKAAQKRPSAESKPASVPGEGLVKRGNLYAWPTSLEGYTVVLLSAEDRPSANAFANEVAGRNDAKAGIIVSDDFSSLPQGFFIVFGGSYDSRERADQAAQRLSARYPGAFAQLVKR